MVLEKWMMGEPAALSEILDAREKRVEKQAAYLENYGQTLVCLNLNIPGPIKRFPLADCSFLEGEKCLHQLFSKRLLLSDYEASPAGMTGYAVVLGDARWVKKQLLNLEETHPLGRLYDFDVLTPAGEKLSREDFNVPKRRCLICDEPAFSCGRSRKHSAAEVFHVACQMMGTYFEKRIIEEVAALMCKGMVYEVTTTPKPGLVDRHNSGAHRDMDIGLFMDSIDALEPYFRDCVVLGLEGETAAELFTKLRQRGVLAESEMYRATGGVNTHKGMIFSGGIFCGAVGYLAGKGEFVTGENLKELISEMTAIIREDYHSGEQRTKGQDFYRAYGLMGIRGEALKGYPTVFDLGCRAFETALQSGKRWYGAAQYTLLYFMAYSEDTNIIARSDIQTFRTLQEKLRAFLEVQSVASMDLEGVLGALEDYFMAKNISPGGSADLLSLVFFIKFLEKNCDYLRVALP